MIKPILNINGKEFGWGNIKVLLFGQQVLRITKISYKTTKDKVALYGAGNKAHSVQHGRRASEGSIEIAFSELTALNTAAQAAGYADILDVELDIVVTFMLDGIVKIDTIKYASFKEIPTDVSEGDTSIKCAMPFTCLDIIYK